VEDELQVKASMTGSGKLLLRLVGEFDAATASGVTDELGQWLGVRECTVDLTECPVVDSAGIRALLHCRHELGPGSVRVVGVSRSVERTLRAAGLESELEISWPDA
jgi:anti-anti-sigma factor